MNLCSFIGHNFRQSEKWVPSFSAPVITEYEFKNKCKRCGKTHITSGIWNGSDFDITVDGEKLDE